MSVAGRKTYRMVLGKSRRDAMPRPIDDLNVLTDVPYSFVGIRLTYDDNDFRENRGRCWQSPVPRPEWNLEPPGEEGDNLGFRITHDREGSWQTEE